MQEAKARSEIEQKYALRNAEAVPVRSYIAGCCKPDGQYAAGRITSIYYDSPDGQLYQEKVNSDYIKTKVRLRWYSSIRRSTPSGMVPCFLEVKRKVGSTRQKLRHPVEVCASDLAAPYQSARIAELAQLAYEQGYCPPFKLVPVVVISYIRHRYIDPVTRSRISLDTAITCQSANAKYVPAPSAVTLNEAVMEVKGTNSELPPTLLGLRRYVRKTAFSKYSRCLAACYGPMHDQD